MLDTLKSVPPHEAGLGNSLEGDLARLEEMLQQGDLTHEEYLDLVAGALSAEQIIGEAAATISAIPEVRERLLGRLSGG